MGGLAGRLCLPAGNIRSVACSRSPAGHGLFEAWARLDFQRSNTHAEHRHGGRPRCADFCCAHKSGQAAPSASLSVHDLCHRHQHCRGPALHASCVVGQFDSDDLGAVRGFRGGDRDLHWGGILLPLCCHFIYSTVRSLRWDRCAGLHHQPLCRSQLQRGSVHPGGRHRIGCPVARVAPPVAAGPDPTVVDGIRPVDRVGGFCRLRTPSAHLLQRRRPGVQRLRRHDHGGHCSCLRRRGSTGSRRLPPPHVPRGAQPALSAHGSGADLHRRALGRSHHPVLGSSAYSGFHRLRPDRTCDRLDESLPVHSMAAAARGSDAVCQSALRIQRTDNQLFTHRAACSLGHMGRCLCRSLDSGPVAPQSVGFSHHRRACACNGTVLTALGHIQGNVAARSQARRNGSDDRDSCAHGVWRRAFLQESSAPAGMPGRRLLSWRDRAHAGDRRFYRHALCCPVARTRHRRPHMGSVSGPPRQATTGPVPCSR